jgi:Frizzled/Smoothened family membrane region
MIHVIYTSNFVRFLIPEFVSFKVDGDSISGVCFAANVNSVYRGGFVLVPVGFFAAVGLMFLVKGMFKSIVSASSCYILCQIGWHTLTCLQT